MYGLLGELRIGRARPFLELPGGYTLVLLAALLLNSNHGMSKTDLIRAAWGDEDVKDAQLHKRVNEIRELLGRVGRRDDLKTLPRFGYELRVSVEDIDSLLFQRLVDRAREARGGRRTEDEIELLRRALRLWRGPHPLSNVPSDAFQHEVDALEGRRKRAAVRLFDLELARGGHERILPELVQLAGDHPTDRPLRQQLMLAWYRCGHLTDATAAYEQYRGRLAEETGGEPDPALRTLHFAIARGDETAIALAESAIAERAGAPRQPATAVPRQLPPDTELVGRDDLAAEASWLLRRERDRASPVIVISGPGGIGKTALAIRASHESSDRYPDGQLYAELRSTAGEPADIGELLAQFLRAFGAQRVPETKPERLAAYRTLLADRRVLIVLDDAVDGAQVGDLVPANPGCAVVVTARQRLPEISGAHHLPPLDSLRRADATELFARVVRSAGIELVGEAGAVDRVVGLCGGLPLALRIAGALRARDHPRSTADLASRLARQGLAGFAYGDLSLARTIGAGFDRLEPAARRLFLGLGQLRLPDFAPWTAAALLAGTAADPGVALSQLAASFMIEPVEAAPRYRCHDLTREYAERRARAAFAADTDTMPALAYRALLTLTRRAHANLYGGAFEVVHSDVPDWVAPPEVLAEVDASPVDWFEQERANIRAAVDHCAALGLTGVCWDLAVSAHEFYTIRGYFDDWYATHTRALQACRAAGDTRGEGIVLACLGQPALVASRPHGGGVAGPVQLERAAGLLADAHDRHGQAIALRTLANALRRRGHLARPLELFTAALGHYTASGDPVGRGQALRFIGQTHLDLGNHRDALAALEAAAAVAADLGGGRLVAQSRYWIGQAQLAIGNVAAAAAAFADVFGIYRDDTGVGHAYALHGLGDLAVRQQAYQVAERHFGIAADLARGSDAVLEGRVQLSTSALHRAQGAADLQVAALTSAVAVFVGCGAAHLEARALAALGAARAEQDDAAGAAAAWGRLAELYAAGDVPPADRIYRRPAG